MDRHHLDEDLLSVLQSLEERLICYLQILIVLDTEGHLLDLLLRVYKGDDTTTRAKDQLRLILEHDLDDFVGVSEQDGLLGTLPLLDVDEVVAISRSGGRILLGERKLQRLEFLVAVQVALEVL